MVMPCKERTLNHLELIGRNCNPGLGYRLQNGVFSCNLGCSWFCSIFCSASLCPEVSAAFRAQTGTSLFNNSYVVTEGVCCALVDDGTAEHLALSYGPAAFDLG